MSKLRERLPSLPMVAALLSAALLAGCQSLGSPQGAGTMTFEAPGYKPATPAAPPPAGLEGIATTILSKPAPRTGPMPASVAFWQIQVVAAVIPSALATSSSQGQVSFGSFNGTIQPGGSLHMQAGPTYVDGQFIGTHFEGRFWRPGPACTYMLSLSRCYRG